MLVGQKAERAGEEDAVDRDDPTACLGTCNIQHGKIDMGVGLHSGRRSGRDGMLRPIGLRCGVWEG